MWFLSVPFLILQPRPPFAADRHVCTHILFTYRPRLHLACNFFSFPSGEIRKLPKRQNDSSSDEEDDSELEGRAQVLVCQAHVAS
jgi:hypothetical protein